MFRVLALTGKVVYQECNQEQNQDPDSDGQENIEKAQGMDVIGTGDGDKGRGAARGVEGARQVHEGDSSGHGEGRGQPRQKANGLEKNDTDSGGDKVTADQVTGLGQGRPGGSIDKDGRGAEGAEQEQIIATRQEYLIQEGQSADAAAGTQP